MLHVMKDGPTMGAQMMGEKQDEMTRL